MIDKTHVLVIAEAGVNHVRLENLHCYDLCAPNEGTALARGRFRRDLLVRPYWDGSLSTESDFGNVINSTLVRPFEK